MKLTKENVCVFIENEAQLQQAREVLEKYGEKVCKTTFFLSYDKNGDNLQFSHADIDWYLSSIILNRKLITLTELGEILKGEKL